VPTAWDGAPSLLEGALMPRRSSDFRSALFLALVTPALGCSSETGTAEQHHSEGPKLASIDYEVLFTNPVCRRYEFGDWQDVVSEGGEQLLAKPENVFCTYDDIDASAARPQSPQRRLIDWIEDPATTEVFFTALSFSNYGVRDALCQAIEERDVKVSWVMDESSDTTRAESLMECQPSSGDPARAPSYHLRGHVDGIGYAHNKMVLINPGADTMKIAFGSGNMSSGVVLHHENWHFVTIAADTYFAQQHLCLMTAEIDHGGSGDVYRSFMRTCLDEIPHKRESDIQVYFVPADGYGASHALLDAVERAEAIDIAAHRFSYWELYSELSDRLGDWDPAPVRIVADDDMYWAGRGNQVGDNMAFEYEYIADLEDAGAELRWMETNHGSHLLHHNKFVVFDMPDDQPDSVFCGAGNLTDTAFSTNWENFYYVTIPEVVEAYRAQYEHLYQGLATRPLDMPTENVLPPTE
jgi:hypothetical protein